MAIIGLIGALAGGVYGVIQILHSPVFEVKKVFINIEIVLDRSSAMQQSFDRTTKWEAAVRATKKSLAEEVAQKDNLALRQFGGPCRGDNTKLVVDFDQNNEGRVRQV